MDIGNILFWISLIFLLVTIVVGLVMFVPQVIKLHKNKYADNSSIWLYVFFILCNVGWTIYQVMFIYIWLINHDYLILPKDKFEWNLLLVQLINDIVAVVFGLYALFLKIYYMKYRKIKNITKLNKLIDMRKKIHNFQEHIKEDFDNQLKIMVTTPTNKKINHSELDYGKLSLIEKISILMTMTKKLPYEIKNKTKIYKINYQKINPLINSFIKQSFQKFPNQFIMIARKNIKNLNDVDTINILINSTYLNKLAFASDFINFLTSH